MCVYAHDWVRFAEMFEFSLTSARSLAFCFGVGEHWYMGLDLCFDFPLSLGLAEPESP